MNTCSICNEEFKEYPCDPHPLCKGRCCARCDALIVLPLRMIAFKSEAAGYLAVNMFRMAMETRNEIEQCRLSNAR